MLEMDPNKESFEKNIFAEATTSCQQAVGEAWDFTCQTALHLDKRAKQAEVLAHGLVVGGLKDTPNEMFNHTGETLAKVGITGALGACLGAAMASRVPWVKVATHTFGLLAGGTAIAATAIDFHSRPKLQTALADVWHNDKNEMVIAASKAVAEAECGPEGFNWMLAVPSAAVGAAAGKVGMSFVRPSIHSVELPLNRLQSRRPTDQPIKPHSLVNRAINDRSVEPNVLTNESDFRQFRDRPVAIPEQSKLEQPYEMYGRFGKWIDGKYWDTLSEFNNPTFKEIGVLSDFVAEARTTYPYAGIKRIYRSPNSDRLVVELKDQVLPTDCIQRQLLFESQPSHRFTAWGDEPNRELLFQKLLKLGQKGRELDIHVQLADERLGTHVRFHLDAPEHDGFGKCLQTCLDADYNPLVPVDKLSLEETRNLSKFFQEVREYDSLCFDESQGAPTHRTSDGRLLVDLNSADMNDCAIEYLSMSDAARDANVAILHASLNTEIK